MFASSGNDVRALELDRRGSWSLTLGRSTAVATHVVVGRSDARPRLARFARMLPQLQRPDRVLARADLRYTNGFALGWADAAPPADETNSPPAAGRSPQEGNT